MSHFRVLSLGFLLPFGANACEVGETRHFACSFENGTKAVELCHDDMQARYVFGPARGPAELRLTRALSEVGLVPWPGIGRTIWEEITFENEDHAYVVHGSIERVYPQNETDEITVVVSGGILVEKSGREVASLICDPDSVDFPWSSELFDAKEAAGQCYDPGEQIWQPCQNNWKDNDP